MHTYLHGVYACVVLWKLLSPLICTDVVFWHSFVSVQWSCTFMSANVFSSFLSNTCVLLLWLTATVFFNIMNTHAKVYINNNITKSKAKCRYFCWNFIQQVERKKKVWKCLHDVCGSVWVCVMLKWIRLRCQVFGTWIKCKFWSWSNLCCVRLWVTIYGSFGTSRGFIYSNELFAEDMLNHSAKRWHRSTKFNAHEWHVWGRIEFFFCKLQPERMGLGGRVKCEVCALKVINLGSVTCRFIIGELQKFTHHKMCIRIQARKPILCCICRSCSFRSNIFVCVWRLYRHGRVRVRFWAILELRVRLYVFL